MRAPRSQCFSSRMNNCHLWQLKKSKYILGTVLELPAKQQRQFSPFGPLYEVNGLDWQCYFAGSSKTSPSILIFSIAIGAEYLSYVKSIATVALTFFGYIISVLASVQPQAWRPI